MVLIIVDIICFLIGRSIIPSHAKANRKYMGIYFEDFFNILSAMLYDGQLFYKGTKQEKRALIFKSYFKLDTAMN